MVKERIIKVAQELKEIDYILDRKDVHIPDRLIIEDAIDDIFFNEYDRAIQRRIRSHP